MCIWLQSCLQYGRQRDFEAIESATYTTTAPFTENKSAAFPVWSRLKFSLLLLRQFPTEPDLGEALLAEPSELGILY